MNSGMHRRASRFVEDGFWRFLHSPHLRQKKEAITAQVRAEYADALSAAAGYWRRRAIKKQINHEITRRLKSILPSSYALWHCF